MNASQLSLWTELQPEYAHHHIEVHRQGGQRYVVCTGSTQPRQYYADEIYAGFVASVTAECCHICNGEEAL